MILAHTPVWVRSARHLPRISPCPLSRLATSTLRGPIGVSACQEIGIPHSTAARLDRFYFPIPESTLASAQLGFGSASRTFTRFDSRGEVMAGSSAWTYKPIADLATLFLHPPVSGIGVIAGAAISTPSPSDLPAVRAWKPMLVDPLIEHAGLATAKALRGFLVTVGTGLGVKLEAIFQSISDVCPGLDIELLRLGTEGGKPNSLHEMLAELLERNSQSLVVTPNFDELIEAAIPSVASWSAGQPWLTGKTVPRILHVHGNRSLADSLWHTFSRMGLRLIGPEEAQIKPLLARTVVCLGWAGTDKDITTMLEQPGEPVHFLISGTSLGEETTRFLERAAEYREVQVYQKGFDELLGALGQPPTRWPSAFVGIEGETRGAILSRTTRVEARRILASVTYRMAINDRSARGRDREMIEEWARALGPERTWALLARASREQAFGSPARAAFTILRAYRLLRDPHLFSEAGDAIERCGWALIPGQKLLALPLHRLADRRMNPDDPRRVFVNFRLARCLSNLGASMSALRVLEGAERMVRPGAVDMWTRGHLRRLHALLSARTGASPADWLRDIADAREFFDFENRPLELGSLQRTTAACWAFSGGDDWRGRASSCLRDAARYYKQASDTSAFPRLAVQARLILLPRPLAVLGLRLML